MIRLSAVQSVIVLLTRRFQFLTLKVTGPSASGFLTTRRISDHHVVMMMMNLVKPKGNSLGFGWCHVRVDLRVQSLQQMKSMIVGSTVVFSYHFSGHMPGWYILVLCNTDVFL